MAASNASAGTAQFGIFDWIDTKGGEPGAVYEERLRLLEYADGAGFFCYHLAEHHHTPLGLTPSPNVFLTAVAQRTRRLHFGPLVYLLPLYDPIRLAGEIAMLDQLSGGRLEVGVGRGVSPYELGYHHVDPARSREIFREALDVIVAALTSDRVSYHGRYYDYDDVPIVVHPRQRPYPPLWYATSSAESIPWVAERHLQLMRLGPAPAMREGTELYRRIWAKGGGIPGRLNPHVERPYNGMNRQIYVAPTDEEAQDTARRAFAFWFQSFDWLWAMHGDTTHARRGDFDAAVRAETVIAGSPDTVRQIVARALAESGCNYISFAFAWGNLTIEQSLSSMRLFAEEVMPAFTASQPAAAPSVTGG